MIQLVEVRSNAYSFFRKVTFFIVRQTKWRLLSPLLFPSHGGFLSHYIPEFFTFPTGYSKLQAKKKKLRSMWPLSGTACEVSPGNYRSMLCICGYSLLTNYPKCLKFLPRWSILNNFLTSIQKSIFPLWNNRQIILWPRTANFAESVFGTWNTLKLNFRQTCA